MLLLGRFLFQDIVELVERGRFQTGASRIARTHDRNLDSGHRIDGGHFGIGAQCYDFDENFAPVAEQRFWHHAARRSRNAVQTVSMDSTSWSICASVCIGDGVMRRRSVPRGTVGKLIGCT